MGTNEPSKFTSDIRTLSELIEQAEQSQCGWVDVSLLELMAIREQLEDPVQDGHETNINERGISGWRHTLN